MKTSSPTYEHVTQSLRWYVHGLLDVYVVWASYLSVPGQLIVPLQDIVLPLCESQSNGVDVLLHVLSNKAAVALQSASVFCAAFAYIARARIAPNRYVI